MAVTVALGVTNQRFAGIDTAFTPAARYGRRCAGLLAATATAAAGLLVQGLVVVTGSAAPPIMVLIAAASAWGLWSHRPDLISCAPSARPRNPGPSGPNRVPVVSLRPIGDGLSIRELCQQWRHSYRALHHARDLAGGAQVVTTRAGYLDELERRDPVGFHRWLDEGARAAGDPSRFLTAYRPATDPRRTDIGEST